jgi:hypothetical protein
LPADSERKEVVAVAGGSSREPGDEIASVPVAIASSRIQAELLVGMLLSNGVHAVVSADDAAGLEPQLQIHGVRVLVAPSDELLARRLLAEAE